MTVRKIINGSLRAYIQIDKRWRHVYVLGSYDQTTLVGDPVRMVYFKLAKNSKDILSVEKSKLYEKKPATHSGRKGVEA